MSKGKRHQRQQLLAIADPIMHQLRDHGRCSLAGSLGRGDTVCGDIDLVFEPHLVGTNVKAMARNWGKLTLAGDKWIQIQHPSGVQIDLFIVRRGGFEDALARRMKQPPNQGDLQG